MEYYNKEIFIPAVDDQNNVLNPVERHGAHKEGILHRGFTVGIFLGEHLICQHRKHPLFDDCLDLTASSHPMYVEGKLIDSAEMILLTLEREWGINSKELISPLKLIGKTKYRAEDKGFIEHEVCEVFTAAIKTEPSFNSEYAYGSLLVKPEDLSKQTKPALAPWVAAFLEAGLF